MTPADLFAASAAKIKANEPAAAAIGVALRIVLEGEGGGAWCLRLRGEPGVLEGEAALAEPHALTVRMSAEDYVGVVSGRASAALLFFDGKIKIEGGRLADLLGQARQFLNT